MTADKHISGKTPLPQDQTSETTKDTPESWTERSIVVLNKLIRAKGAIAVLSSAAKMRWDATRIGSGSAAYHLQLMASIIQSEVEGAELLWDSIERPPCMGTELGVYAAERFVASIEGILWIEVGAPGAGTSLPDFSDIGHAADIAREQLENAIQALSAAIKLGPPSGSITTAASQEAAHPAVKEPAVPAKTTKKAQAPTVSESLAMEA